jgi:hypothetical protein
LIGCAACGPDALAPVAALRGLAGDAGGDARYAIVRCPRCGTGRTEPWPSAAEQARLYASYGSRAAGPSPAVAAVDPLARLRVAWGTRTAGVLHGRNRALAGLPLTAAATVLALLPGTWSLNAWAMLAFSAVANLALAYGYFHFVNLNLASLRIRLLSEFAAAPGGLPLAELFRRCNAAAVVTARLERLVQRGHLQVKDGRYVLVPNRAFLLPFEVFEFLKFVVLGRGSRLLANIPCQRRAHPLLGVLLFVMDDRVCRSVAVAVVNVALGYGVYAVLVVLGLGYRPALVVLALVTSLSNILVCRRFAIGGRRGPLVVKFICVCGTICMADERILTIILGRGFGALTGQALVLPLIVCLLVLLDGLWVSRGSKNASRKVTP